MGEIPVLSGHMFWVEMVSKPAYCIPPEAMTWPKSDQTDHQPRLDAWDKLSDLVHWKNLGGAGGEGGGRGDRDGEHM